MKRLVIIVMLLITFFIGNSVNAADTTGPAFVSSNPSSTDLPFKQLITGNSTCFHTLGIKYDGTVWAWGSNTTGQIGNGSSGVGVTVAVPTQVMKDATTPLTDIVSVSAGAGHTLALKSDGTVWAWGDNTFGQLGNATLTSSNYPVQVVKSLSTPSTPLTGIVAVAAGQYHSLALDSNGKVWSWGCNLDGRLGIGVNYSILVASSQLKSYANQLSIANTIKSISAGEEHSLALDTLGNVWAWGDNEKGQLGVGSTSDKNTPTMLSNPTGITAISSGEYYSLVLDSSGYIWTWGENDHYQLGDGTTTNRTSPYKITSFAGITAISAGESHALALDSISKVWAWGYNNHGQLGDGTTNNGIVPIRVKNSSTTDLTNVVSISAGDEHSLVIKSDGTSWAWGNNYFGQIGDGTNTKRLYPVQVVCNTAIGYIAPLKPTLSITYDENISESTSFSSITLSDGTNPISYTYSINSTNLLITPNINLDTTKTYTLTIPAGSVKDSSGNNCTIPYIKIYFKVYQLFPSFGPIIVDSDPQSRDVAFWKVDTRNNCSVALRGDGTVWTWGYNYHDYSYKNSPVQVMANSTTPFNSVIDIVVGDYQCVFLKSDGTVWTWGLGNFGQSGDGTTVVKSTPVQVITNSGLPLNNIIAISTGCYYCLALKSDGTVWAWGYNSAGQLGDGSTTQRNIPVQVPGLNNVSAISAGAYHSLVLKLDGTVWAWGDNEKGQLGDGSTTQRNIPVQVPGLNNITAISAGAYHSLILKNDNTVWACGYNSRGQLGNDTTTNSTTYVQVASLAGISKITAGNNYAFAVKSDNTVWAWGCNDYGQLGDGTTTQRNSPVQISGLSNLCDIKAGTDTSIMLKNDGTIWTWGSNQCGKLSSGIFADKSNPIQISGLPSISSISANGNGSICVTSSGNLWVWGNNTNNQIINSSDINKSAPIINSSLTNISKACTNYSHSLAIKSTDSSVWAWGLNSSGQLGNNSTTSSTTPVQVSSLNNVSAISAGTYHSLALKLDGNVWAWGYNNCGQLGNGSTTNSSIPVQVSGLSNVIAISAGNNYSLALKSDGTVWAWGYNYFGQLGNGSTTNSSIPVQVSGLSNVIAISAGNNHSLALKSDCTVWAWGYNFYGQLGDNTTVQKYTPVQVTGLTNVSSISAGNNHSLALKSDGTVWAWGGNSYGQIGDGTGFKSSPVQITLPPTPSPYYIANLKPTITITYSDNIQPSTAYGSITLMNGTTSIPYTTSISDNILSITPNNNLGIGKTYIVNIPPSAVKDSLGNDCTIPYTKIYFHISVPMLRIIDTDPQSHDVAFCNVSSGYYHSLALRADSTVWAWGVNWYGQLGNGTYNDSYIPIQVMSDSTNPLTNVTGVSAGSSHSIAVKSDGTVWAWGCNSYGQLGNGTTNNSTIPVQVMVDSVNPLTDVIAVSAGKFHSAAVKSDGTVWTWGYNGYGQLGNGTNTSRSYATQVTGLRGIINISTTSPSSYCLALKSDGTVWAWGCNDYGQLGDGTNISSNTPVQVKLNSTASLSGIVSISAGGSSSLALRSDGTVWAWGWNYSGQLGNGTNTDSYYPVQVKKDLNNFLTDVITVTAGSCHSLAGKSDGTVWAWGYNNYGQLGDDTTSDSSYPVQVFGLTGFSSLNAGRYNGIALKSDGTIWSWGFNDYGLLGIGVRGIKSAPVEISSLSGVTNIGAGGRSSYCVTSGNNIWFFGDNSCNQLYNSANGSTSVPVQVSSFNYPYISIGGGHSVAVKSDGTVWTWGYNGDGQLGNGSTTDSPTPVQVKINSTPTYLTGVSAASAGDTYSLAISSGNVYAWGDNYYGQLGIGTTGTAQTYATLVQTSSGTLTEATAVSTGCNHSLAVSSGNVYAWGDNTYGQLGIGTAGASQTYATPVKTSSGILTGITAISAGNYFSLALDSSNNVWSWGYNNQGQLGDGTTTACTYAKKILTGVKAISEGGSFGLALTLDGNVYAWGQNTNGYSITPVQVTGLSNITAIAAGFEHSLALKSDGTVWVWGENWNGQLGDGTGFKTIPVQTILPNPPSPEQLTSSKPTITITYSDNIQSSTAYGSISLMNGVTNIPYTASISGNILSITPNNNLDIGKTYIVNIPPSAVKDSLGNNCTIPYTRVYFATYSGVSTVLHDQLISYICSTSTATECKVAECTDTDTHTNSNDSTPGLTPEEEAAFAKYNMFYNGDVLKYVVGFDIPNSSSYSTVKIQLKFNTSDIPNVRVKLLQAKYDGTSISIPEGDNEYLLTVPNYATPTRHYLIYTCKLIINDSSLPVSKLKNESYIITTDTSGTETTTGSGPGNKNYIETNIKGSDVIYN